MATRDGSTRRSGLVWSAGGWRVPRIAVAAALGLHGLIHLVGFVTLSRLATVEGFPYRTAALNGAIPLGDTGAAALGVAWLVLAVGFLVASVGVMRRASWAAWLACACASLSIAVCVLGLPEAAAGIVVNVVILAGAVLAASGHAASRVG